MIDEVDFCNATSVWNTGQPDKFGDETAWVCEPDNVVESRATVEDFETGDGVAKNKTREEINTEVGILYIYENVKPRRFSQAGNLFVMENGALKKDLKKTFSYFVGVA